MKIISTGFFLVFVFLIGITPFRILYIFSDFIRFFIYNIIGYRKKVVFENLRNCFPDKTEAEIRKLTKLSYTNLTDVIVESIKAFSMSDAELIKRYKLIHTEALKKYEDGGLDFILATCHYSNWEWGSLSPALQVKHKLIALYKPLSNPYLEKILVKSRSRTGTQLASIYKTSELFKSKKDVPVSYMMAADQNPGNPTKAIWINFLGRPTAFLDGIERYAKAYDLPVVFADIKRIKRGYYTVYLETLTDTPRSLPEGKITQLYVGKLVEAINRQPENWLWSHKRWKMTIPEGKEVLG